jgi:hypothetical protein
MLKMSNPEPGYNPIEKIRGAHLHWIVAPFNGVEILVQVRCLNFTQLRACGNMSLLEISTEPKEQLSTADIIEIKNQQEELMKQTLVYPTFDGIIETITEADVVIQRDRKELQELRDLLETCPAKDPKRIQLEKVIDNLELSLGFLLPDDFAAAITSWAMGIDRTDIKKLTREILLEAAIMAAQGNDNPADHITGVFTDFQREDINKNAWIIYAEYRKEKEIEEKHDKSGFRWIGGKAKKKT